ncbi:restriction endonuclease subunit S [Streptomyces decoyicus]|uniref:restriction endonuclease subunit S n=1 Tax=Streptomyces decoyicus TaxID=249567 RepID=UPI0037F7DC33
MSGGDSLSGLPKGWVRVRLDEIAEVRLGRQRSPKNHSGTQMRPYLRAANVDWSGLKLDDVKEMNFTDDEVAVYGLQKGDIVLSEASGSASEVGKPAIWSAEIADCCFQNTLIRVRSHGVDQNFLLHFLRGEAIRGAFVEHSRGVGIHHIGVARLAAWQIALPPLEEQRRIVAAVEVHLSHLEKANSILTNSRKKEKRLRRATLQSVRAEAVASGAPFRTIAEIADTSLGKMLDRRKNSGKQTLYLRNINVRWGSFDLTDVRTLPMSEGERAKFSVRAGDLLVCEGGEPGRCAIWPDGQSYMAFQKALHRVRPRGEASATWIAIMLEEAALSKRFDYLLTGTTIKHLPQEKLRSLRIPVPGSALQTELARRVFATDEAVSRLSAESEKTLARATALENSLRAEAFAGRLVSQDLSDEPATELLARIRAERKAADASGTRRRGARRAPAQLRRTSVTDDTAPEAPPPFATGLALATAVQPTLDLEIPS